MIETNGDLLLYAIHVRSHDMKVDGLSLAFPFLVTSWI